MPSADKNRGSVLWESFDLFLVLLGTILALGAILALPPGNPARVVFALPQFVAYPGYGLAAALWVKRADLEPTSRIGLAFGLSIALVISEGLLLALSSMGITSEGITTSLFVTTLLFVFAAFLRRTRVNSEVRFIVTATTLREMLAIDGNDRAAFAVTVVTLVLVGILAAWIIYHPLPENRYILYYVTREGGGEVESSWNLTVGEESAVSVVVENHLGGPSDLTVALTLTNSTDRSPLRSNLAYVESNSEIHALDNQTSIVANVTGLDDTAEWSSIFRFVISEPGEYALAVFVYVGGLEEGPYVEWPEAVHVYVTVSL